ncbi:MAG: DNA cytosine methyltransferase [Gammaproteobacteria bacterium]|nr:DNA cytosine methyltransferase [Gammaproteobacteria bacterium]
MVQSAPPEVWSFFTGAMGLDLGLEQAGLSITLANEINPLYCKTILVNRPDVQLLPDGIEHLTGPYLRSARSFHDDVYMMVGGPPCQSFSSGGKRASLADSRGNLMYEYLRLIGEVRPQYFILENVANLTTAALRHRPIAQRPGKHWSLKRYDTQTCNRHGDAPPLQPDELSGSAIRKLLPDIQQLQYRITFGVLDAADFGAPQHRLRFIMLGSRDGPAPALPAPTHGPSGSGLNPFRTVRQAIASIQHDPGPGSQYTAPVKRYFDLVPSGGNWRDLPPRLQPEALGGSWSAGGGKTGFYRRLPWDAPSPTITGRANRKGSALCHPEVSRPISVREAATLQGFPPEWQFAGSMNAQYQQIGNAVPVPLGKAVANAILHQGSTDGHSDELELGFDEMLNLAIARLRSTARNKRRASRSAAA